MNVESLCPYPVAFFWWHTPEGQRMLTVICKTTFQLAPRECFVSPQQLPIHPEDVPHDGRPGASLYAASDFVPAKASADITVVGSAFAAPGTRARSVTARVIVGDVDKAVEVVCDRHWTQDDQLVEGARFARMPIRYEYARGGEETRNPVGIDREQLPDMYGRVPLPNLQPPGLIIYQRSDIIEPTGMGPMPAWWPTRAGHAGMYLRDWSPVTWRDRPLPPDFDLAFFNSAPRDQQQEEIRPNEHLVLEHLHPEHTRLITALPGIRPKTFVASQGAVRELTMKGDTLWFDTDQQVCTVTWRAAVELDAGAEASIYVAEERLGERVTWLSVQRQVAAREAMVVRRADGYLGPSTSWPVRAEPTMDLAAGTVVWRVEQTVNVSVIVKAVLDMHRGTDMTLAPAEPIRLQDDYADDGRLLGVCEISPVLPQADVYVLGDGAPDEGDRRVVLRSPSGEVKLDRTPEPEEALGPFPRRARVRERLLGGVPAEVVAALDMRLPRSFDWSYFQCAPHAQRAPFLAGDEWVELTGLVPGHDHGYRSRLPSMRAVARVMESDGEQVGGVGATTLTLVCDMLRIDPAAKQCTLVWRGSFVVDDEAALGRMVVSAGVLAQPQGPAPEQRERRASGTIEMTIDELRFDDPEPPAPSVRPSALADSLRGKR